MTSKTRRTGFFTLIKIHTYFSSRAWLVTKAHDGAGLQGRALKGVPPARDGLWAWLAGGLPRTDLEHPSRPHLPACNTGRESHICCSCFYVPATPHLWPGMLRTQNQQPVLWVVSCPEREPGRAVAGRSGGWTFRPRLFLSFHVSSFKTDTALCPCLREFCQDP